MRVALYARASTQRQAQAQTVEQQVERLMGHACQQGWGVSLDHVFRDDGKGASLGSRRLRTALEPRWCDRLARNYVIRSAAGGAEVAARCGFSIAP